MLRVWRVLAGAGGVEEGGGTVGGGGGMCGSRTVTDGRWVDWVCGGDVGGLLRGLEGG